LLHAQISILPIAAEFPSHVAAEWLGHSQMVAQKHYWQVTDADFEKAAKATAPAVQNAVQSAAVPGGNEESGERVEPEIPVRGDGLRQCTIVQVGGTGLEQTASSSKENEASETGDAQNDAQNDAQAVELALIANRWQSLTLAMRSKILKLVVSAAR
jgi:hypothetical protein